MPKVTSLSRLTIAQVADELQSSPDTVRRMIARGELRAYRYGQRIIRIDRADLDKMRKPVTRVDEFMGGDAA